MPRILLRPVCRSLALIPLLSSPEWTPLVLAPLPALKAALMPLIIGDLFSAFSREHRLPACAVEFVTNAGSWSALNSRSGFVPSTMLADFTDDTDQAVRTLCAAGVIERARGGIRFAEDCPVVTVVDAADVEEKAARKRAADAERQRKSRANRTTMAPVTPMSHVTSRDTPIDRSDLSIGGGQSKSDARAREKPELVTAVADAIGAKIGYPPTDEQAREVIAVIRERARKAGQRIRNPLAYIPASVANEPDLWNGLLEPEAPPLEDVLAGFTDVGPDNRHAYEHNPATGTCRECDMPRSNTSRHLEVA